MLIARAVWDTRDGTKKAARSKLRDLVRFESYAMAFKDINTREEWEVFTYIYQPVKDAWDDLHKEVHKKLLKGEKKEEEEVAKV